MTGTLGDLPSVTTDRAESEAEAANRQNVSAARDLDQANAGHGEPGGQATHVAGGTGPTGRPVADAGDEAPADIERPDPGSRGTAERGMLGEGV